MRRHTRDTRARAIWGTGPAPAINLLALLCLLAVPTHAQTVTPAAPPLPDLPLTVSAGWDKSSYAPGDQARFGVTLTNSGPPTVAGHGTPITTQFTVTWADAAGNQYSAPAGPYTVQEGGVSVPNVLHVSPISISFPAVLTPKPNPTWAYTFLQAADSSWLVTLPAMDVAGGGGSAGGRILFTVGTAPTH